MLKLAFLVVYFRMEYIKLLYILEWNQKENPPKLAKK